MLTNDDAAYPLFILRKNRDYHLLELALRATYNDQSLRFSVRPAVRPRSLVQSIYSPIGPI